VWDPKPKTKTLSHTNNKEKRAKKEGPSLKVLTPFTIFLPRRLQSQALAFKLSLCGISEQARTASWSQGSDIMISDNLTVTEECDVEMIASSEIFIQILTVNVAVDCEGLQHLSIRKVHVGHHFFHPLKTLILALYEAFFAGPSGGVVVRARVRI
jgi:hypothetical protein